MLPKIALESSSYQHKNRAFGKIKVPVFKVTGWESGARYLALLNGDVDEEDDKPAVRAADTNNDDIPF
jgi:hypothetical protein